MSATKFIKAAASGILAFARAMTCARSELAGLVRSLERSDSETWEHARRLAHTGPLAPRDAFRLIKRHGLAEARVMVESGEFDGGPNGGAS